MDDLVLSTSLAIKLIPSSETKEAEYFINQHGLHEVTSVLAELDKEQQQLSQVAACVFPAIFVAEDNLCITGLCSVLRYLIAELGNSSIQGLLGYQGNCLTAPAEVSTWTKFCEIDLPKATQTFLNHDENSSSSILPYELAQFEVHLGQPVKIHNIRKRMQQDFQEGK